MATPGSGQLMAGRCLRRIAPEAAYAPPLLILLVASRRRAHRLVLDTRVSVELLRFRGHRELVRCLLSRFAVVVPEIAEHIVERAFHGRRDDHVMRPRRHQRAL